MNSEKETNLLRDVISSNLSLESQVDAIYAITKNVLDKGAFRARTIRFKLEKYIKSENLAERIYGINTILAEGKSLKTVPTAEQVQNAIDITVDLISDELAKRYVQNKIEAQVEQAIMEKQDKYVDEVRLSVINKQKGIENKKTKTKLEHLVKLDN